MGFVPSPCESFFIQRYDNEIDPQNPNYQLLNAGLLRAANEVRLAYNLPELQFDTLLQKVAESHAIAMIEENFYAHKNPNNQLLSTVMDRVNYFSHSNHGFKYIGENIASYDILAIESVFCVKRLSSNRYFYYNCQSKLRIPIYTYKQLAVSVVNGWLNSPSHRENLLDPNYKYLGTAARLSKNPYLSSKAPFARIVQDFGG